MAVTGRPTDYTQEIADEICSRLANGESLRAICASDDTPHIGTVLRWVVAHPEFREQYEESRRVQAETMADEIVGIADGEPSGDVQRDRLRVDARKWVASKLLPKKYGDKVALTGDADGDPIKTSIEVKFV